MANLKKGQVLPNTDHVMRQVSGNKCYRDSQQQVTGFYPDAFQLRTHLSEKDLSVNWVEFFACSTHAANAAACKAASNTARPSKNAVYGVAQVDVVVKAATHNTKSAKVIFAPTKGKPATTTNPAIPPNPSHAGVFLVQPVPDAVGEELAREFYKEHY